MRFDFEAHIRDPFAHHVNIVECGKVWRHNVSNTVPPYTWDTDQYIGIDVEFPIHSGLSWLFCLNDPDQEYSTPCDRGDCRIMLDGNGDIIPYDAVTGYGCRIQYAVWGLGGDASLGIAYILYSSGFLPSTVHMNEEGLY